MSMLVIIADDLTGAMDTGLQFSKRGLDTLVTMGAGQPPQGQVLVVDTDSRAGPASVARQRILALAPLLRGHPVLKKIDSTLRGNVGYELRALTDLLQPRCIVVAPAFPDGGRTTVQGCQLLDGRPLELTTFAHDPRWPMRQSHVPTLLMQQAGREVGEVGLDTIAGGVDALVAALRARPEPLVVVDAVTQGHLLTLARALRRLGPSWLPCGSAGLGEAWAEVLAPGANRAVREPAAGGRPVLAVVGSRNDRVLRQVRRAERVLELERVDLDPYGCHDPQREQARLAEGCLAILRRGRDALLTSAYAPLLPGLGRVVADVLAGTVARVGARQPIGGLFLTGGDIAVATCRALGAEAVRLAGEVQPGIPLAELVRGTLDGLWLVTKAGGFGDDDALVEALGRLHGGRPRSGAAGDAALKPWHNYAPLHTTGDDA